jgi:hypothetical protein
VWFETDVSGIPIGSILKMEPTGSSETSVSNYLTPRDNPEDEIIQCFIAFSNGTCFGPFMGHHV